MAQAASVRGEVELPDLMQCLYATIQEVLQGRSWGEAFDADGFGYEQTGLASHVRVKLGLGDDFLLPSAQKFVPWVARALKLVLMRRSRVGFRSNPH